MKTMSEMSSSEYSLSTSRNGPVVTPSRTGARRGPSSPRCSQTDAEPGPPLNANVTGRSVRSSTLSSV